MVFEICSFLSLLSDSSPRDPITKLHHTCKCVRALDYDLTVI